MLVMPQAIRRFWPITTSGRPGKEKPVTSKRPPWRPTSYQTDGIWSPRWVSLARIGLPVFVRAPPITQLLLAHAGPPPGIPGRARVETPTSGRTSFATALSGPSVARAVRSAPSAPSAGSAPAVARHSPSETVTGASSG